MPDIARVTLHAQYRESCWLHPLQAQAHCNIMHTQYSRPADVAEVMDTKQSDCAVTLSLSLQITRHSNFILCMRVRMQSTAVGATMNE